MPLTDLFNKVNTQDRFFLSLFLADKVLQAGLWTVDHNQVELLETSASFQYETPEGAINQADVAFQELGPDSEQAKKIVFGFEPSWIDKAGVHTNRKAFLKKLTTDLNLEPVGFVSLTESILQQLLVQDVLLSAVVLVIHDQTMFGSLIKAGKVLAQISVSRTEKIITDTQAILTQLTKQAGAANHYLPAELLLVSALGASTELTTQQQELQNYAWAAEFSFVETPKIELLPSEFAIEAITHQGGLAVAKARGLVTAVSQVKAQDFDQLVDQPETSLPTLTSDALSSDLASDTVVTASSFGVVLPAISATTLASAPTVDPDFVPISSSSQPTADSFVAFAHSHHPIVIKKIILIGAFAGLLTVILAGLIALWLLFSVSIQVQLATGLVAKEVKITLDPKISASDPDNLILKAELTQVQVQGSDTAATTGVKLVGEKAAGIIKIFNKTTASKTFAKNTELTAGSIKFVIQDDVSVASASVTSSVDSEVRDYGEAEAKVMAIDIGAEANLTKDTALKIANFDQGTYAALVKDGLAGGSSREVRVVALGDKQKLLKTLTETLTQKAAAEFKTQSSNGTFVIPTGKILQSTSQFDGDVGKEAEVLNLDLTAQFEGLQYNHDDLAPLIVKILGTEVPEGFKLSDQDPQILSAPESSAQSSASTKVVLSANISAQTEPNFEPSQLQQQLVNLPLNQAETLLKTFSGLKQSQIQFLPGLARWLVGRMPNQTAKIIVTVVKP